MSTAVQDEPAVSGEVVPYAPQNGVVEEYRPRIVMPPDEARALDTALRDNMKAVLREDVDYGVIPGTGNKPTLLKPGAEKLLQWFGFGHTMEQVETERGPEGAWLGVTYRCTVTKAMPDGRVVVVGTCEGYAGYDEDRFYLSAEAATAKERANAERYRRQVNQAKCVEYRAPRNSVVKMAQKRALVGAALQATSASTLFTQDVEDAATVTETASPVAVISEAAMAAIMGLPVEARKALDRWCREQGWPARAEWDTAQWCAALVQAGRSTMEHEFAAHGVEIVKPAADPWATPGGGEDWVEKAVAQASQLSSKDAADTLYKQAVAKQQAGEITREQRERICQLVIAQVDHLAAQQADGEPIEGAVVPPDAFDWQAAVDSMSTREDALPLLDKLEKNRGVTVNERQYKALKVAIRAKADSLPSAPGEAA